MRRACIGMTYCGAAVYMSNLTFNTSYSLACVGGSSAKGQSEHESVEMPVGSTMRFPQPLLKDRALLPADKTFRLNTRSCGSQLSWGFPKRPCGQEFHPFLDSSWNSHSFIFPICPFLVFSTEVFFLGLCDSHEQYTSVGSFFVSVISCPFPLCCGLKPKSRLILSYLLTTFQLEHAIRPTIFSPNQARSAQSSLQTRRARVRGSQSWRHCCTVIINRSQQPNPLMCFGYVNIKVSYTKKKKVNFTPFFSTERLCSYKMCLRILNKANKTSNCVIKSFFCYLVINKRF